LLEAVETKLELAIELVVSVKDVVTGRAEDELLKLKEVDTGVTTLEFAPEPVANDEYVDDTVELITTLVLVGIPEVLRYDAVVPTEVANTISELVAAETFMLGIAITVLVKNELVFVETYKTVLKVDEVLAKADAVTIELVTRVPLMMELEVAGEIELELVVDVAFGTTTDTNRAPQTLP